MARAMILVCLMLLNAAAGAQSTSKFPAPLGFINDFEHDFTPEQVKQLDYEVKELLAKTMAVDSLAGIEMAVVTVTDDMFGNEKEISAYATRLGDKWGVGKKGENKAIIIAYGKKIRKVAIVTGAGLDYILPPAVCHRIVDERMATEFRKGNYFNAMLTAVKSIKQYLGIK